MKRTVVVTGVMGGIGAATARVFEAAGWMVFGVDARGDGLQEVEHFVRADLADEADSIRVFRAVGARIEHRDALVNNAAIQICKPLLTTTPTEWDQVMNANVRSIYLAVRHSHPLMQGAGGAIVNVGSVHAIATSPNIAAYATSKGAVLALTRALATELAVDRIRVNAVLPGAVDTSMLRAGLRRGQPESALTDDLIARLGERHLLGRVGQPEEIAQAILFLCEGERSSFVTGQALIVDGGATARLGTE